MVYYISVPHLCHTAVQARAQVEEERRAAAEARYQEALQALESERGRMGSLQVRWGCCGLQQPWLAHAVPVGLRCGLRCVVHELWCAI